MSGLNDYRKDQAEKARGMVVGLVERLVGVIEESGATEEEALAAVKSIEAMLPILQLESSHGARFLGGQ